MAAGSIPHIASDHNSVYKTNCTQIQPINII